MIDYDDYPDDAWDMQAQYEAERRYAARLAAFPDCRDPDHPGCELCCPEEFGVEPDEPDEDDSDDEEISHA